MSSPSRKYFAIAAAVTGGTAIHAAICGEAIISYLSGGFAVFSGLMAIKSAMSEVTGRVPIKKPSPFLVCLKKLFNNTLG
jgi:hypothetical protein